MIRIKRCVCPKSLSNANSSFAYRAKAVVKALHKMQHGKCCYCEQNLPEVGHLKAVQHFHPKAIFHGLTNEWTNLLLACAQCNGKKSDDFPVILSNKTDEDKVIFLKKQEGKEFVRAVDRPIGRKYGPRGSHRIYSYR